MSGARPQRLVFGEVAAQYERHRPGYPDALYDLLVGDGSVEDVLDVGTGTGRAAVALAERGLRGIGVEPSVEMAAIARTNLPDTWTIETTDFEACRAGDRSDWPLITCAQAWHWIDHDRGLAKAAALLRPGGVLALFWNRPAFVQDDLRGALDEIYDRLAPDMQSSLRGRGTGPKGQLPGVELGRPPTGFTAVRRDELGWERTYTSDQWIGLLETQSDHRLLEPDHRAELHGAVRDAIDERGGQFTLPYRVEVLRFFA
ncbi:class I SAM-dependent methyltransferase [Actinospongicola halichondriae]|uniref:class I SAM-dependent methyltransferase n=1 Tax=Actinospongicola halichondriae TaxID=3236844 RepID=UPI003D4B8063